MKNLCGNNQVAESLTALTKPHSKIFLSSRRQVARPSCQYLLVNNFSRGGCNFPNKFWRFLTPLNLAGESEKPIIFTLLQRPLCDKINCLQRESSLVASISFYCMNGQIFSNIKLNNLHQSTIKCQKKNNQRCPIATQ